MAAAASLCKYEGDKVLLVEGPDDCHVIMSLCNAHRVPEVFGIYECGGDDRVLMRLNALISQPDAPTKIGVVLDADQSVERRWQSIRSKLSSYTYTFPDRPDEKGTILRAADDLSHLGFWLMPDNKAAGMLEDFCLEMVQADARRFVTETVVNAQRQEGVCTFRDVHRSKAEVHTYLAWQDEPGVPLGKAITALALRPDTPTAMAFVAWLGRLFN